jgi:hypothetical protein
VVISRGAACLMGLALSAVPGFARPAAAPPASDAAPARLTRAQGERVLQQARAAHYSLWGAGMEGLSCKVQPDWDAFYQQMKVNSVGRTRLLPLLRPVELSIDVAADGSATVTHHPEVAAIADPELAASARSSVVDIENTVRGFLATWSSLAVDTPLPKLTDDYQLESLKGKYLLTYNDGPAVVHTTIGADLAVEEMFYAAPALTVSIHPSWIKVQGKFVLSGYEGRTELASPSATRLTAKIDNRTVEGLQLPAAVRFSAGTEELRFTFSDCLVTKRPP